MINLLVDQREVTAHGAHDNMSVMEGGD